MSDRRPSQSAHERQWRYADWERPRGECYDCGLNYDRWGGDMDIPDHLWEEINPTYHEGSGLLCPTCIVQRVATAVGPTDFATTVAVMEGDYP